MQNIFKDIPEDLPDELIEKLAGDPAGLKIERIISRGHASSPDFWYDQEKNEFVILLKGRACLVFKGQREFEMSPGDYIDIPSHTLHRVEWTTKEEDTVWLAIYY